MKWFITFLFLANSAMAGELEECVRLAPKYNAKIEVRMRDGTRCDLLTPTHAIEVDYARKWAEGIGQALHYADLTGKKPGVVLLMTRKLTDWYAAVRISKLCGKYGVDLYLEMLPEE